MTLKTDAFPDLERELATTRVFLERVPDDHLDWKPHEKSFSLGQIAGHLAHLPTWQVMTLTTDGFDVTEPQPRQPEPENAAEILAEFDKNVEQLTALMETVDEKLLRENWSLKEGEKAFWTDSKLAVFRLWGINHLVHHRAQLGLYLRMLDIPVPGAYGPSADEGPVD
jgi:uncharacterized damage-inducible protein DinB